MWKVKEHSLKLKETPPYQTHAPKRFYSQKKNYVPYNKLQQVTTIISFSYNNSSLRLFLSFLVCWVQCGTENLGIYCVTGLFAYEFLFENSPRKFGGVFAITKGRYKQLWSRSTILHIIRLLLGKRTPRFWAIWSKFVG